MKGTLAKWSPHYHERSESDDWAIKSEKRSRNLYDARQEGVPCWVQRGSQAAWRDCCDSARNDLGKPEGAVGDGDDSRQKLTKTALTPSSLMTTLSSTPSLKTPNLQ